MKTLMVVSTLSLSALCSTLAQAQMPPPQPPPPPTAQPWAGPTPLVADGPGNGLQLNLDVFGFSGSLAVPGTILANQAGGAAVPLVSLGASPSVDIGYYFDQNAILLDLGFGATSGTDILFEIEPTYRRYFSPLRTGVVSPFAEGSVEFGIFAPNAGTADFGVGFGGALGAEWMFTRNIGLEAAATLGYFHLNETIDTVGFNIDTIALGGKIGLTVHM